MDIHEHANWPDLRWDEARLAAPLAEVRYLQGAWVGRMQSLGFSLREEAALQTLTQGNGVRERFPILTQAGFSYL